MIADIVVAEGAPFELMHLETAAGQAKAYARQAKAANTRRAYQSDWRHFESWCQKHGLQALPASPETVAVYVTTLAEGYRVSTLQRRLATISQAHQVARLDTPTTSIVVREVMAGIRRVKGTAQRGKSPALIGILRSLIATLPDSTIGRRDRALLLIGFAGAFRRSELVALDLEDVVVTSEGLVVTIRRSKTDQEGEGRKVGLPYGAHMATCPVRALQAWLQVSRIASGPLFRSVNRHGQVRPERLSGQSVALIVKRTAQAAGFDPMQFSGHSLRAGLATSAAASGVSERAIMAQTGHRSIAVARRYIREGSLFHENAAGEVGL